MNFGQKKKIFVEPPPYRQNYPWIYGYTSGENNVPQINRQPCSEEKALLCMCLK